MKIGIFDSGLGGLIAMRAVVETLPTYDYVYIGDTANLPYGSRSREKILQYTEKCIDYLFREHDCKIVLMACNTAAIAALRYLQTEYLPKNYPDRRVLGIIIPTIEAALETGAQDIGLIATVSTTNSKVYEKELQKINPNIKISSVPAPLLVPLIEYDGDKYAKDIIKDYLAKLPPVKVLVLGCTHYPMYKDLFRKMLPDTKVISQDEILPEKVADYLARHDEIRTKLSHGGTKTFIFTDITPNYVATACRLFGHKIAFTKTEL
ncbi:MAG: glutamate racemase [Alphaproteobacteria bacterium]|nr:glutamate racemase [Alphaproteobacteria bacterium]